MKLSILNGDTNSTLSFWKAQTLSAQGEVEGGAQDVSWRTLSYCPPSLLPHWAAQRAEGLRSSKEATSPLPPNILVSSQVIWACCFLKESVFEFQNDSADSYFFFVKAGEKVAWPWGSQYYPLILGLGKFGCLEHTQLASSPLVVILATAGAVTSLNFECQAGLSSAYLWHSRKTIRLPKSCLKWLFSA